MDKSIFAQKMKLLELAFQHKGFAISDEALPVWYSFLGNLTEIELEKAVRYYIEEETAVPTIGGVLKYKPVPPKRRYEVDS